MRNNRELFAELYCWGLIPGWAKDLAIGNKLANARRETVAGKPSFRNAFKRWRYLIPGRAFPDLAQPRIHPTQHTRVFIAFDVAQRMVDRFGIGDEFGVGHHFINR
jgi:putative SOS response-associated peptidase YedK